MFFSKVDKVSIFGLPAFERALYKISRPRSVFLPRSRTYRQSQHLLKPTERLLLHDRYRQPDEHLDIQRHKLNPLVGHTSPFHKRQIFSFNGISVSTK
jgi:hypothetical protein